MKQKSFETLLYSAIGVAATALVFLSIYVITSATKVRLDVTADKAHTLSAGTKKILASLDSRITLRFYCSQADNAMPPGLRTYARHIEDLLHEFQQEARGKLIIQKFDPRPDSDAEESARINGVDSRTLGPFGTDKIYLGLVVSLLDEKFALPWLAPERERLLEYDISRAIARVTSPQRPLVGIMSGLPVFGEPPNLFARPGEAHAEDWAFVTELKKDFTLQEIPLTASNIDEQVKVLLVIHPVNVPDSTQYALDQFVQHGGKLIAFLDPHAYFDQKHDRTESYSLVGDNAACSSLDKLLRAWGLQMDTNRVAADTSFASRNLQSGDIMPTLLLVTRAGIDEKNIVTSQIDNLVLPFAGAFTGKPADGLKETVLVKCSASSQLIDGLLASAPGNRILRDFKAANVEYPLAIHLTGKFKSAFPNGVPASTLGRSDAPNAAPLDTRLPRRSEAQEGHALAAPQRSGGGTLSASEVVLVADTDMLNDKVCVREQEVGGHRVFRPVNGNLSFIQGLVEQFAGDEDLISSRSRASMSRPFTRVKDMEAKAGQQWQDKVRLLETKQRETEQKIQELQNRGGAGQQAGPILSAAQEQALDGYQQTLAQVSKELKEVRKNLRKDTEALEFQTKVINIGAMPLLIAFSGLSLAFFKRTRRP
jgi:ABC-type uncharacterized transport system involved in gliding motility auxiliary subunit